MKNDEAVEKIDSLLSFRKAMKEHGIDWQIRTDNMLHGKVYIFKNNDAPFAAIITSSNLTQHGLGKIMNGDVYLKMPKPLAVWKNSCLSMLILN